jgi:hypothetical protein
MSDRRYALATAPSKAAAWAQEDALTWAEFIERLPAWRCYVPGTVEGPTRDEDTVTSRSGLTLDEDEPGEGWLLDVAAALACGFAVHVTKRSTPDAPRYRLLVPLSRDVSPEEYWLIAEAVMDAVGWGKDRGGREHERLMYGPGDRNITVTPGEPLDGGDRPGSPMHGLVTTFGHAFNKKFKPWEAVKWASRLNKVIQAATAIYQIYQAVNEAAKEDKRQAAEIAGLRAKVSEVAEDLISTARVETAPLIDGLYATILAPINEGEEQLDLAQRERDRVASGLADLSRRSREALSGRLGAPDTGGKE